MLFSEHYEDDEYIGHRLEISKDRLAVPSISPDPETDAVRSHPNRSRRKKAPRPKSAPKRSSSSPIPDYTSPEEEAFSEEEIKLPIDEFEEEEEKVDNDDNDDDVDDDRRRFRTTDHLDAANSQVTNWHEQEN